MARPRRQAAAGPSRRSLRTRTGPRSLLLAVAFGCSDKGASEFEVHRVLPSTVDTRSETLVTVEGRNFYNRIEVNLDDERAPVLRDRWSIAISDLDSASLGAVRLDEYTLTATIPAGLPVGLHDVEVTDPAGRSRSLADALAVVDAPVSDGSGGTGGTSSASSTIGGGSAGTSAGGSPFGGASDVGGSADSTGGAGAAAVGGAAGATGSTDSAGSSAAAGSLEMGGAVGTAGVAGAAGTAGDLEVSGQGGGLSASCSDTVQNQDETGIDCGGTACPPCDCGDATFSEPEVMKIADVLWFASDTTYWAPSLSADGLTLFFAVNFSGSERIYQATRESRDTVTFSGTTEVFPTSVNKRGSPALSYDGLTLYFYVAPTGTTVGGRTLSRSTRSSINDDFSFGEAMSDLDASLDTYLAWPSRDGLRLYYVRENPLLVNSADVWMAERASVDDDFTSGVEVTTLNSLGNDGRVAMTPDENTVYFSSNRGSLYDEDLWMSVRSDGGSFSTPTLLTELNSLQDDKDVTLTADGTEIFFVSKRSGSALIYRSTRTCE